MTNPKKTKQLLTCARCSKKDQACTLELWNGPRGFRRYPLCVKCKTEATPSKAKAPGAQAK